jgi:hypothetical protein
MEMKNLSRKEIPIQSNQVFVRALEMYIDLAVRGLVAFLTLGLFSYFVLIGIFHLPVYVTLPIVFLLSIAISPLLSKIKLGYKIQEKYDDFLKRVIYSIKQHETRR